MIIRGDQMAIDRKFDKLGRVRQMGMPKKRADYEKALKDAFEAGYKYKDMYYVSHDSKEEHMNFSFEFYLDRISSKEYSEQLKRFGIRKAKYDDDYDYDYDDYDDYEEFDDYYDEYTDESFNEE